MLKILENNLTDSVNKQQYDLLKCELDETYGKVVKGIIVKRARQKCKEGEMSSDFFVNLVKEIIRRTSVSLLRFTKKLLTIKR